MILNGAKVLVIGASGGLGKAVVLELCKQHVGSLFLCGRNEKELLSLKEQGQEYGISIVTTAFDLRDESLLTAFFINLKNDIWIIEGNLDDGYYGGVAHIEIRKNNGEILKVIHGK